MTSNYIKKKWFKTWYPLQVKLFNIKCFRNIHTPPSNKRNPAVLNRNRVYYSPNPIKWDLLVAVNCTNLAQNLEDNTSAFHQRFFQILQMALHQVYLLNGILMGIFRFWPLINRIQGTRCTDKTYIILRILCV